MGDDTLQVISATSHQDQSPLVVITYQDNHWELTVPDARERAEGIFQACATAESEANIFTALHLGAKGFAAKQSDTAIATLRLLRKKRSPLIEGIDAILSLKSQQPIVVFNWYGGLQFETESARHHARLLLECAEAAETDGFMRYFFQKEFDVTLEETQSLINKFAVFRQRNQLESLFNA